MRFGPKSTMGRRPTRSTSTRASRRPITPARGRSIGMPPPPPSSRGQQAKRTPSRGRPINTTGGKAITIGLPPPPPSSGGKQAKRIPTQSIRKETPKTSRQPSNKQANYLKKLLSGVKNKQTSSGSRTPVRGQQARRTPVRGQQARRRMPLFGMRGIASRMRRG
jgi:hypothetical protein